MPNEDFNLKEISPKIGAKSANGNVRITSSTDLVEFNHFLFLNIVKARDLFPNSHPFVEVKVGDYNATTLCDVGNSEPEWNQIFALDKDRIPVQDTPNLEILLKRNLPVPDVLVGRISFDISEIPSRFPTNSSLALQWHRLEDQNGRKIRGEIMLSTWIGSQVDEAFREAFHLNLDGGSIGNYDAANTRSRIYLLPRVWYLRVRLIEANDLVLGDGAESSQLFVRVILGTLIFSSKLVKSNNGNPQWNEDLIMVVAEPFDQKLVLSVEQGTLGSYRRLGKCVFLVKNADVRLDGSEPSTRNIDVEHDGGSGGSISVRISLDGGYHVFDESPHCSSDMNPSSMDLWRPRIGVFEMGILNATGLAAMKGDNRTDAYCVAKYGTKWVRTRTVVHSLTPKWNEQYSWDVYDPCTFITVCVFDDCQSLGGGIAAGAVDTRIGRVRIRLSDLETNRIYSYSYPLVELQPSGLKKMGEIQLAFKFCCADMVSLFKLYTLPMLPEQNSADLFSRAQSRSLRKQSVMVISSKMRGSEPPLSREVVEHMLEIREAMWSMRRCRADLGRISTFLSGLVALYSQFDEICKWKNPTATVIICLILFITIFFTQVLMPTMFSCLILRVLLQYRKKSTKPSHFDLKLSQVHTASVDELEEEFDPMPSRFEDSIIRRRYDRLRIAAGKYVALIGVLATRGEKLQSLLSWQDRTTTLIMMIICLITGIVTLSVPFQAILSVWLLYLLRHPILRSPLPSLYENWVRRMPTKLDSMI